MPPRSAPRARPRPELLVAWRPYPVSHITYRGVVAERLADLAEEWLNARATSGGRTISSNTIDAYRRDLNVWINLLTSEVGEDPTTEALDPVEVTAALSRMMTERKDANATRRRAFVTMSNFCNWLILHNKLDKNPLLGLNPPKQGQKLPVAFADEDVAKLLEVASKEDPTAKHPAPALDLAILILLGAAGLRASEAITISYRDYRSGEEPLLHVTGKGGKQRVVPLDPAAAQVLDDYLAWRSQVVPEGASPSYPFLVKPDGQPLTRYVLDYRVRKLYARAGVTSPKGAASHALRHTFAISSLNGGAAVNEIQDLLGHESMATTGLYLRASAAHLRSAASASAATRLLKRR